MILEQSHAHAEDERQDQDGPAGLVDGGHVEAVAQVPGLKQTVKAVERSLKNESLVAREAEQPWTPLGTKLALHLKTKAQAWERDSSQEVMSSLSSRLIKE